MSLWFTIICKALLWQFLSGMDSPETRARKVFSLIALVSDEAEVFRPKYSQTAICHAAYFRWVVKPCLEAITSLGRMQWNLSIYYPPEVRREEYWGLGVFLLQYFPLVNI